jgi:hypothetical protein
MTRRQFLAAGGSALLWLPAARPQAPRNASGVSFVWNGGDPPPEIKGLALGTIITNQITEMPPAGEKPIPFSQSYIARHPRPRPTWSQLLQDKTSASAQRTIQQVKDGYIELLRRSSENKSDPTGLLYQCWLHSYYCSGSWPGGDLHTTWLFLPWHRAFIYFHERILADAVGDPDFRLPAWDWEQALAIPAAFTELGLPSFLTGNYSRAFVDDEDKVDMCARQGWLLSTNFEDFCGTATTNPALRSQSGPHTAIHTHIVKGAMKLPTTAAADPLFYAHHANVDRFWSLWLQAYQDTDPKFARPQEWLDKTMYFRDERRQLVAVQVRDLLDEAKLGYSYESMPSVSLYQFDSPAIPSKINVAARNAIIKLAGLVIAYTVQARQLSPDAMLDLVRKFVAAVKLDNLAQYFRDAGFDGFPIQITGRAVDHSLEPGKYYMVHLQRRSVARLGGFGVFEHAHEHNGTPEAGYDIAVTSCLRPDALRLLLRDKGDLRLVYGPEDLLTADVASNSKTMIRFKLDVLVPKVVSDAWEPLRLVAEPLLRAALLKL